MKFRHLPLMRRRNLLLKPFQKLLKLFKFKLRKPLFIRSLQFHRRSKIRSRRGVDRVTELTSFSETVHHHHHRAPHPSPLTPAYARLSAAARTDASGSDDVDEACRSFEKYLSDMIVEEGKMRDLVDVEELLHCWKKLRSPVFIDLVCRFYGELCRDLFSSDVKTPNRLLR